MAATVTFTNDILPMFFKWKSQMIWRLDLTSYDDVKKNATVIYGQLASGSMPPPPYPPLTPDQASLFLQWMQGGYLQ